MSGAWDGLSRLLVLGGPVVMILVGLSVVALAVVLLKGWQFIRIGRSSAPALRSALASWSAGGGNRSVKAASRLSGSVAPILQSGMYALGGGVKPGLVKEDVERLSLRSLTNMRSGLRVLEVIAQTAPLLGLFGTVLGMIEAFRQLQAAGTQVDPAILAGGIWVALLTTAAGLAVAMPVSLILAAFEARIAREAAIMEDVLTALFTGAPAELSPPADTQSAPDAQEQTYAPA